MLFEEHCDLFLERHLPVVFFLALDVFRRILDTGDADAERTVAFLPLEVPMLPERVVNPFGRTGEGVHRFWIRCVLVPAGRPRIAHRFNGGQPIPKRGQAPQGRKKSLSNARVFFRP